MDLFESDLRNDALSVYRERKTDIELDILELEDILSESAEELKLKKAQLAVVDRMLVQKPPIVPKGITGVKRKHDQIRTLTPTPYRKKRKISVPDNWLMHLVSFMEDQKIYKSKPRSIAWITARIGLAEFTGVKRKSYDRPIRIAVRELTNQKIIGSETKIGLRGSRGFYLIQDAIAID